MAKILDKKRGVFAIEEDIAAAIGKAKEVWQKQAPPIILKNIKKLAASGSSPVQGEGQWDEYSDSYQRKIIKSDPPTKFNREFPKKTVTPVNLFLSGGMIRSFSSKKTKSGFTIFFTDPLAHIHSEQGAGKSKVIRKIFPSVGQTFKNKVTLESDEMIRRLTKKELEKPF